MIGQGIRRVHRLKDGDIAARHPRISDCSHDLVCETRCQPWYEMDEMDDTHKHQGLGADNHESLDSIPDKVIAAHVLKRMTESLLQRRMF